MFKYDRAYCFNRSNMSFSCFKFTALDFLTHIIAYTPGPNSHLLCYRVSGY